MKKILVCEDEAAIRDFVVINLVRGGYDVIEADCGEAALKKYDENGGNIDVAILDVMMPGMDGFQVCKELRQRNGSIGIIMLTAKTQEMDKVTGLLLGADDYVTKPFSPSELVARVAFNSFISSTAVLFICCRFFCNIINIISLIVNNFIRAFFRYFIGIALYISLIVSNSAVYIYVNSTSINAKAAVKRNINIPCVNLLNSLRRFL